MKKLLPYIAAFLTFFGSAKAQDNFPYDQNLSLEYKIEAPWPVSKKAKAKITNKNNRIEGNAHIPFVKIPYTGITMLPFILSDVDLDFLTDLNNNIHVEGDDTLDIPQGYKGLIEGLFCYMNYIRNTDSPVDTSFHLFVTGEKKEILVKIIPDTARSLELKVKVVPEDKDENLIETSMATIPYVVIYFKEGIPTEAYAPVNVIGIPIFTAHGYLINNNFLKPEKEQ